MINIHFIAIGGSVMHDLAICMKKQGYNITGSDDKFHDPSKSKLAEHNLLPAKERWDINNITSSLDLIVFYLADLRLKQGRQLLQNHICHIILVLCILDK